jgi:DNA repair protein RecO (recombination protein O)
MIVSTEAIILHSRKFSDSSKIVSIFTKDYGRISILAKGAMKPKSKFSGSLEPLTHSFITLYKSPGKSLYLLSSSETINSHHRIYHSFEHLSVGMIMLEIALKTQEEQARNEYLFSLLCSVLTELELPSTKPFHLLTYFYLRLIESLGFAIEFNYTNQFESERKFKNNIILFSLEDGVIKNNNSKSNNNLYKINHTVYKFLSEISSHRIDTISNIDLPEDIRQDVIQFLSRYLGFHLEKKMGFKSFNLLFDKNIL